MLAIGQQTLPMQNRALRRLVLGALRTPQSLYSVNWISFHAIDCVYTGFEGSAQSSSPLK